MNASQRCDCSSLPCICSFDRLKYIKDHTLVFHGAEHPDYFQGYGTSFTHWTDCSTGIGSTVGEALEDCLEGLAQQGYSVEPIEDSCIVALTHEYRVDLDESLVQSDDRYFYVSVAVQ